MKSTPRSLKDVSARYIVVVTGDVRECAINTDDNFQHVLNSSWQINRDDPRIQKCIKIES
jgi:hypothetical protein